MLRRPHPPEPVGSIGNGHLADRTDHTRIGCGEEHGVAAAGLVAAGPASAKVEGDTIVLGSAISFTGKYSTNGIHAKNGYNIASVPVKWDDDPTSSVNLVNTATEDMKGLFRLRFGGVPRVPRSG